MSQLVPVIVECAAQCRDPKTCDVDCMGWRAFEFEFAAEIAAENLERIKSIRSFMLRLETHFGFRRGQFHRYSVDVIAIEAELGRVIDVPMVDRMKVLYVQLSTECDELLRGYMKLVKVKCS